MPLTQQHLVDFANQITQSLKNLRTCDQNLGWARNAAPKISTSRTSLNRDKFRRRDIPRMQILFKIRVNSAARNETNIYTRRPKATNIANFVNKSRDALLLNCSMFRRITKTRANQCFRNICNFVASNLVTVQKCPAAAGR